MNVKLNTRFSLSRLLSLGFGLFLLFASVVFMDEAKALTLEETLTRAGQNFLSSMIDDYNKDARSVFDKQFKQVKQTVNALSEQVQQVADPNLKPAEREKLLKKIAGSQTTLRTAANSFDGLAQKTAQFDNQLENAVSSLLNTVQNQVRSNLTNNQDALEGLAKAVSELANDTKSLDSRDLSSFANQIGGHLNNFDQVLDTADRLLKSFAS